MAFKVGEFDAGLGEDGHVAVGEEVDVAGVVEDAGDVGGDEGFALADADDDGRAGAGGDDFVRLGSGEDAEREGSGEALDGAADGHLERDGRACCFGVFLHLLDEVGDDFGVGFGDERVALGGELALQVEVIFDDAVVDDDDAARAVAVRMGVFFCGAAMGCPAGVADAEGAFEGMLAEDFFKIGELAGGAAQFERGAGGAADGDAGRVVTAVFEAS